MGIPELAEEIGVVPPGTTNHELIKSTLFARIAELQDQTARRGLLWAKVSAGGALVAAIIAVVAFIVSLAH